MNMLPLTRIENGKLKIKKEQALSSHHFYFKVGVIWVLRKIWHVFIL